MPKRRRFKDTEKAKAKATLVKPRRGEDYKARHARRKSVAIKTEAQLQKWCEDRGLSLSVTNNGHHWCIRFSDDEHERPRYQWWPSTAKCVYRCAWKRGIHIHDIMQLIAEIEAQEQLESRE